MAYCIGAIADTHVGEASNPDGFLPEGRFIFIERRWREELDIEA